MTCTQRMGISLLVAVTCAAAAWAQTKPAEPWSAKDTTGKEVSVPPVAGDRPTILVFVRLDQPQSRTAWPTLAGVSPIIVLASLFSIIYKLNLYCLIFQPFFRSNLT